jgi:hypothetical protein
MCGSINVRWRSRRWYDVLFTNVRWYLDRAVGGLLKAGRTESVDLSFDAASDQRQLDAIRYRKRRDWYEDQAGGMTARRFWKCGDCHRKGEDFGNIDNVLATRADLAGLESRIIGPDAAVQDPIDERNLRPPPFTRR